MRRRLLFAAAAVVAVISLAAAGLATGALRFAGGVDPGLAEVATSAPTPGPTSLPTSERPPTPTAPPTQPPAPPYVPSSMDWAAIDPRLQAALDARREELAAPGLVASVVFPDGRQWTGVAGVADLATGRELSPDTPFAIASVSKTFLAAEILSLVDEGRLGLEDAVAPLLPDTLVGGAAIDGRITVHMLLDHTSGLRDFLVSTALDRAVRAEPAVRWTPAQALSYAGRPVAPPGKGYHYANTNYVLLGLIAESLSGRSLADEYRARFFGPLGLSSAFYQGVEPAITELPTAYRYTSVRLDATPKDVTDGSAIRPFTALTTAAGAAGSVAASAADLATWARALYGGEVLPERLVDLMVGDSVATMALTPPYPYGLGVQVLRIDGRLTYGHSGRLVGARSVVRWFPAERIAIAIVTNQSRFDLTSLLVDLVTIAAPRHQMTRPLPPLE